MRHKSLWEAISSPANFPNYDGRTGLGYAAPTGFHSQRSYQDSYPYVEDEFEEDLDEYLDDDDLDDGDITLMSQFRNKISHASATHDPYATKSKDSFSYYGSATPTGMFGEAIAMNRSSGTMVPKPDMYKNKTLPGGYTATSTRPRKQLTHAYATAKGWSKAPNDILDDLRFDAEYDEAIENIRKIVRLNHKMNLFRE